MQLIIAIHQCLTVLERALRAPARKVGLTAQDLLILGWLHQREGISAALVADRIGRHRQSVQRALERLHALGLVERSLHDDLELTMGWTLSTKGKKRWDQLESAYAIYDARIAKDPESRKRTLEWFSNTTSRLRRPLTSDEGQTGDHLFTFPRSRREH